MSAQEKGVPFTTSTCLVCHESMRFPCQVARCLTLFCCWCAAAHCVGREAAGGWPPGTADPFLLHGSRREGRVRGYVCTRGEVHSPFFHFVRFSGFLEKPFGTKGAAFLLRYVGELSKAVHIPEESDANDRPDFALLKERNGSECGSGRLNKSGQRQVAAPIGSICCRALQCVTVLLPKRVSRWVQDLASVGKVLILIRPRF